MRTLLVAAVVLTASGCVSTGGHTASPGSATEVTASDISYGPGVPGEVRVERALMALQHGSEGQRRRSRAALLAQRGEDLAPLRATLTAAHPGSDVRLDLLAILGERGEDLAGFPLAERVAADLRVIARDEPGGYATMRALSRLESVGESARPLLDTLAGESGPRAKVADVVRTHLFGTARDSHVQKP